MSAPTPHIDLTSLEKALGALHEAIGYWQTEPHDSGRKPHLRAGALYIDMTTADPEDMRRAQALAQRSGHHFVDVAITGAVNLHGAKTPLLCAGEQAPEVAALFRSVGAPIQVVGAQPGDAASLKLLRSIFTKGLEALSVECLLTAERQGLRAQLHEILGDIDNTSLKVLMESMVQMVLDRLQLPIRP